MAVQLRMSLIELSTPDKRPYFNLRRRIESHKRTTEFRWKAADFIAKNILPAGTSTAILCNLLDGRKAVKSTENIVCKFCKCILAETCHSRLLPRKVQGSKLRNLLRRARSSHNASGKVRFSKYELSLLKKCKLKPANILVTTCSVCHKSQKYPLRDWVHVPKLRNPVAQSKEARLNKEKIVVKNKINRSAGQQQEATLPNLSKKKKKLSMATKSIAIEVPIQKINKNKSLAKPKGKVAKNKGTPEFIKKFKKGDKLAGLIAQDEASKLKEKSEPKGNIFALLHSWVGK